MTFGKLGKDGVDASYCQLCDAKISTRYNWYFGTRYGQASELSGITVCNKCVAKTFKVSFNKIRFIEELYDYRKELSKSKYASRYEIWTKEEVGVFATRLKKKKIPLAEYDVPLYYHNGHNVYLTVLLGKREIEVDVDEDREEIDGEILKDLEKNHDKFLRSVGIETKEEVEAQQNSKQG
jgi:hypothetical protein